MPGAAVKLQAITRNLRVTRKTQQQQQLRTKGRTLWRAGTSAPGIPSLHQLLQQ